MDIFPFDFYYNYRIFDRIPKNYGVTPCIAAENGENDPKHRRYGQNKEELKPGEEDLDGNRLIGVA